MSLATFYQRARWGSAWGVLDAYHPTRHKGLDVAQNMPGAAVPALHAGVIVAAAASGSVGHYVTVRRPGGLFDTYCHIVIGVRVGQAVGVGQALGIQARNRVEGGSAWTGPHTHLCLSTTINGWATWSAANLNPTSGVLAALSGAAGGNVIPFPNTPAGPPLIPQEFKMELYSATPPAVIPAKYLARNSGLVPGKPIYVRFSGGTGSPFCAQVTQDQNLVTEWSQQQFAQGTAAGVIGISWGWFDQMYDDAVRPPQIQLDLSTLKVTAEADPELLAAVTTLITRQGEANALLTALPAEIDRYADGRKQAS